MKDSEVQAKLNQLTSISNELVKEAKRRYGVNDELFVIVSKKFEK